MITQATSCCPRRASERDDARSSMPCIARRIARPRGERPSVRDVSPADDRTVRVRLPPRSTNHNRQSRTRIDEGVLHSCESRDIHSPRTLCTRSVRFWAPLRRRARDHHSASDGYVPACSGYRSHQYEIPPPRCAIEGMYFGRTGERLHRLQIRRAPAEINNSKEEGQPRTGVGQR